MRDFVCFLVALSAWGLGKGAEEENFIRIWPEKPVVEFGGSVVVNCSSSCEVGGLETSLKFILVGTGTTGNSWKTFNLTNVDQWAVNPLCYAPCTGGTRKLLRSNFTVYRVPEHVVMDPVPMMEVGKEYNLTCRVSSVAPIQKLTVTLFKGGKTLLVKTFENHTDPEAKEVVVPHVITVQKEDHGEEITCQAALDLRPEGPLFEKTSPSESLAPVDFFHMDPHLRTQHFVESDTEMAVTCDVSRVFPATEAKFELFYEGKNLSSKITASEDRARAEALVSSSSAGTHELTCRVSLGPMTKTTVASVTVYSLPEPKLHLAPSEVVANATVMVSCTADGPKSPGVIMWIGDARGTLASRVLDSSSVQHEVTVHEEDDGREFLCQVELKVDKQFVMKNTSTRLPVFYAPRMNDSSCPPVLTWNEDSTETFTCLAYGNPQPTVECRRDGADFVILNGKQQHITREYSGTYHCNATNAHGFNIKVVTIAVEYFQPNIPAIIGAVLGLVVLSAVLAVIYYKYYRKQKCGKYILRRSQPQREAGNPLEQKCLNGNTGV